MPGLETLKYRAFISYSHADTRWARWLHRGLESFRIDKDLVGRETSTGVIPEALRSSSGTETSLVRENHLQSRPLRHSKRRTL